MYHIFFIHTSVDGHFLAIVNSIAMNIGVHMSLWNSILYPLDKYLVVQLLGRRVVQFLIFWGASICFPEWLHQFAFPPAVQKGSPFSASSPISVVAWVDHVRHSDWYEVVSYCDFDLYCPDDEWCWTFFHVSVSHLDVFFGKGSAHVFRPFLPWIICCSGVEFGKLPIDFGY